MKKVIVFEAVLKRNGPELNYDEIMIETDKGVIGDLFPSVIPGLRSAIPKGKRRNVTITIKF